MSVVKKEYDFDPFLRPPKWVVKTKVKDNTYYVFLSAMEANEYLQSIEDAKSLHILISRVKPLQDQSLFHPNLSFPETSNLLMQFIIFSGTQYLRNENELKKYLEFIGIYVQPYSDIEKKLVAEGIISENGFIKERNRNYAKMIWPQYKPSPFVEDPGDLICLLCDLRSYREVYDNAHHLLILTQLSRPEF